MFKRAWTDSDMLICWYMLIYVDTINKSGCFSWSYPFIPRFGGMNIPETETILNYRVQYSSRVLTLRTTWEFLPHGSNSSKRSFTENWGKLIWIKNPKRIYSLSIYILYIYTYDIIIIISGVFTHLKFVHIHYDYVLSSWFQEKPNK